MVAEGSFCATVAQALPVRRTYFHGRPGKLLGKPLARYQNTQVPWFKPCGDALLVDAEPRQREEHQYIDA